jgi:hypothetical protein
MTTRGDVRTKTEMKKRGRSSSIENIYNNNVLGGFAPATVATPFVISIENRVSISFF